MIKSVLAGLTGVALVAGGAIAEPKRTPDTRPAAGPQLAQACDPSFGGKYDVLLRRLRIPSDRGQYGECHDYGTWSGTAYKGHANLPPGAYWTYSHPHWYVWARSSAAGADYVYGACPDPTFGGKYGGMLRRLRLPSDRGQYGNCRDYGSWSGSSYKGHTNLPDGYWVYSYPYWIIWADRGR